jgi:hypothetical protein
MPAFRILKQGGADTRPLARRTFGCLRGGQPKATSYFRSLRRPGPHQTVPKKTPDMPGGRVFPLTLLGEGKCRGESTDRL